MNRSIRQHIQAGFEYTVHFTQGVFARDNRLLADVLGGTGGGGPAPSHHTAPGRALFVIDSNVVAHHPQLTAAIDGYCDAHASAIDRAGECVILPGGEQVKNDPRYLARVYDAVFAAGLCRHSYLVAVGGGAIADVAGYAAATAHRGVRLIRIPTTVLAQNDSAVGVKNGINAFGRKNFLGTFAPPYAVINDATFLTTLSNRDWRAGMAEAVKVALIRDAAFFQFLATNARALVNRDMDLMKRLIERCAQLHLNHISVSGDPFESGSSRPLDFGHWAAHKLEQMTAFELRHGEAVAIGIALDVAYSALAGTLPEAAVQSIHRCLEDLGLPLFHPALAEHETLLEGLEEFREHLGGRLTISLLRQIGQGYEVNHIDRSKMVQAIGRLTSRPAAAGSPAAAIR